MGLTSSEVNLSGSVCSWQGVSCDANEDNVVELMASGLSLSGPIPETIIGKLSKFQSLDLSNNKITSLPSDFWSLSSLKRLNLSSNQIAYGSHGGGESHVRLESGSEGLVQRRDTSIDGGERNWKILRNTK